MPPSISTDQSVTPNAQAFSCRLPLCCHDGEKLENKWKRKKEGKNGFRCNGESAGAQLVVPYDLYAAALCLDGPTLANLELLEGSGGDAEGSLLAALDSCASPGELSAMPVCITALVPCSPCLESMLAVFACRACNFCGAVSVRRKFTKDPLL